MGTKGADFLVARDDLSNTKFVETPAIAEVDLADGEVLLEVSSYAFTANNITYAAFGEAMHYWDFFPAPDGWGRVPVWGFAEVAASRHPDIETGERLYGYFPMSSYLVVKPVNISDAGFIDSSEHRQALSPIYNFYSRTQKDPSYVADQEDFQSLFRPLFTTSFLIEDFLADNEYFGAKTIVLSSASSKTAFGLAFQLSQSGDNRPKVVGLTSPGNIPFVEGLGCYDQVASYNDISKLDAATPSVFVDMAGSGEVRSAVHHHFTDNLKYSCSVGASHWDKGGAGDGLPGPQPTLFFAPSQAQKRQKDWGLEGFQSRLSSAWSAFLAPARGWIKVEHHKGQAAIERIYQQTLAGDVRPDQGNILSPN